MFFYTIWVPLIFFFWWSLLAQRRKCNLAPTIFDYLAKRTLFPVAQLLSAFRQNIDDLFFLRIRQIFSVNLNPLIFDLIVSVIACAACRHNVQSIKQLTVNF